MSEQVIEPRFEERLKELGINLDGLRGCLKEFCENKRQTTANVREPGASADKRQMVEQAPTAQSLADLSALASLNELRAMLSELMLDRAKAEQGALAERAAPPPVDQQSLADQHIESIPDEGFYTKPMASKSRGGSSKK